MEFSAKSVPLFLLFCMVALPAVSGQVTRADANLQKRSNRVRTLTRAEGLEIVSVATDSHPQVRSRYDCSHFVHGLYQRAGFPYVYASSSELYVGVAQFRRVETPQPGDLAVWPGHAGIVVNPVKHSFLSVLHSGPGVNKYDSPYWKHRGRPRFFRYVKGAPGEVFSSSLRNTELAKQHQ